MLVYGYGIVFVVYAGYFSVYEYLSLLRAAFGQGKLEIGTVDYYGFHFAVPVHVHSQGAAYEAKRDVDPSVVYEGLFLKLHFPIVCHNFYIAAVDLDFFQKFRGADGRRGNNHKDNCSG